MRQYLIPLFFLVSFTGIVCRHFFPQSWSQTFCEIARVHPLGACSSPYGRQVSVTERLEPGLRFALKWPDHVIWYELNPALSDKLGGSHYEKLVFYWTFPTLKYGPEKIRNLLCDTALARIHLYEGRQRPESLIIQMFPLHAGQKTPQDVEIKCRNF